MNLTVGCAKYLCWWHISDMYPVCIRQSETMAKIVCRASALKSDDPRYRGATFLSKSCSLCELMEPETAEHMIITCPYNMDIRVHMFNDLTSDLICNNVWRDVGMADTLKVLLGGIPDGRDFPLATLCTMHSAHAHMT